MANSFEIEAEVDVSPTFYGWLFQFGNKAQIIGPPGVRNEFRQFGEDTLKQYAYKSGSHAGYNEDLHYSPSTAEWLENIYRRTLYSKRIFSHRSALTALLFISVQKNNP